MRVRKDLHPKEVLSVFAVPRPDVLLVPSPAPFLGGERAAEWQRNDLCLQGRVEEERKRKSVTAAHVEDAVRCGSVATLGKDVEHVPDVYYQYAFFCWDVYPSVI